MKTHIFKEVKIMRDEISEMLDGTIEKLIKKIDDLTPGTPEHSSAVECLNKLYKLKIEETSHEREFMNMMNDSHIFQILEEGWILWLFWC